MDRTKQGVQELYELLAKWDVRPPPNTRFLRNLGTEGKPSDARSINKCK